MDTAQIKRATATGDVTTVTSHLQAVTLTAGADAASVALRAGGASGTLLLTVKAAANTTTPVPLGAAVPFSGGLHATFSGTSPEASFVLS